MKQIFGFDNIQEKILGDYRSNKLHHCTLLDGKIGTGKSSFVYNIATYLLSIKDGKTLDDSSKSNLENTYNLIKNFSHPDFLVLNLNSLDLDNNIVDSKKGEINVSQVRKILKQTNFTPSLSKNRVILIDSMDIINKNGQNALLKTLEEPLKNTYIFLISNNINRILSTVISRSNLIKIPKLDIDDWFKSLLGIEDLEIGIEDSEVERFYYLSQQSVSIAESILKSDSSTLYNDILNILDDKNIITIQNLGEVLDKSNEKLKIFRIFLEKIFDNLITFANTKNNINRNTNDLNFKENELLIFKKVLDRKGLENILNDFSYTQNILNDLNIYNLNTKHIITVLFNKIL